MTKEFKPFVPAEKNLKELTLKAMLIGLVLAVVLGAANAYLGLTAGMTVAATYPAAVLGMAVLRLFKDNNILEENLTRTVGSIGESVAAGAIFTLPAFLIAGIWSQDFFASFAGYWKSTVIMLVGGIAGILFVTLLRRVMVEDPELPFPESVAASEIHKAGRSGDTGAKWLFIAMAAGAVVQFLREFTVLKETWQKFIIFSKKIIPATGLEKYGLKFQGVESGGGLLAKTPSLSPAFIGVGYIIGPRLAALTAAGGVLSWGLFVPLFILVLAPQFTPYIGSKIMIGGREVLLTWDFIAENVIFNNIVKPIAIGGMLMSAAFTLFNMRKSLATGIGRSIDDVRKAAAAREATRRTDKDINIKLVFLGLLAISVITFVVYWWFMDFSSDTLVPAVVAALVMMMAGFFFAAVSGYLCGIIGSSNNPISGLTLSTLVIAAILMVILGATGTSGIIAVLAVAGVICVSSAVAGEMLQDLKVGHILGGTPWRMQVGDFIGVIVSALVMWAPLFILNAGDLKKAALEGYQGGFGGKALAAPQAGLMAQLSKGIVGGDIVWPLIILGIIMAIGFILLKVKSPMLVCVGMYIGFGTVSAIFVGGIIRWVTDLLIARRKLNKNQVPRVENRGVLLASGLIVGEALTKLVFAGLAFGEVQIPKVWPNTPYYLSVVVMILLGFMLVKFSIGGAGDPDKPSAPSIG